MKSGFTAKVGLLAVGLLLPHLTASAQNGLRPGFYVGSDLLKSVWARGLAIEPAVYGVVNTHFLLTAAYGYASLSRDSVHVNMAYRCKGHYVKPGAAVLLAGGHFSLGLSYLHSTYRESGNVTFAGPYFGDKHLYLDRNMRTSGLELTCNVYVPVSRRLFFNLSGRTGVLTSSVRSGNFREVPVFYVPGAGYLPGSDAPGTTGSFGLGFGLMYQVTGQQKPALPEVIGD